MSRDAKWSSFIAVSLRDPTEAVGQGAVLGKPDGTMDKSKAWDTKNFRDTATSENTSLTPRAEMTLHQEVTVIG